MVNILIISNNNSFIKNFVNNVISKISSFKIANIASNDLEALKVIKENSNNLDLIVLDLDIAKLDSLQLLEQIRSLKLRHCPFVFVISSKSQMIDKVIGHTLVQDFLIKSDDMSNAYNKLSEFENNLNYGKIEDELSKKVSSELIYIGYNPSHLGTQYIKECILEVYKRRHSEYIQNVQNNIFRKIAEIHGISFEKVRTNIMKATDYMFLQGNMNIIKDYFHFNDERQKPTPKIVISTIVNKL